MAALSNPTNPQRNLPAMRLAETPRIARRLGRLLLVALVLAPVALIFVPWTQSVHGTGQAIAFNPVQRPQFVVSPIEGRIKKWYVVEGGRVKPGQRIVEMVDNDPNLELRLLDEERTILDRLRFGEGRIGDIESQVRNLDSSRALAIDVQKSIMRQEQARVQTFEQEQIEANASVAAAEPNYQRQLELFKNKMGGLASERDVELARQAVDTAKAKAKAAQARVELGKAGVKASQDGLAKVEADTAAMINSVTASKRSAEADVASIKRDKAQMEVRIARQRAQYVEAPCDGIVMRLLANAESGGLLVKPGERLAVIVPDITKGKSDDQYNLTDRVYPGIVVELLIDGNDLPLVHQGDPARLQFEGWPAVQFIGWPSVAVGTFAGRVYLVDPTSNDKGQFRILVEPDPDMEPWPSLDYLRQGVRAQGWVLLKDVSVGWELWRQINGFPVSREIPAGVSKKK